MAAVSLCCPKCETILKLAARPAEGKKVKCPKCAAVFVAADNEASNGSTAIKSASDRPTIPAASKGRPIRDDDDEDKPSRRRRSRGDDDDENDDDDKPRRSGRKAHKSNTGLIIGLCAGCGVLLLAGALTAGGLIWWLSSAQPTPVAQQAVPDAKVQGPDNAQPAPPAPPGPFAKAPANNPNRKSKRNPRPTAKAPEPPPQPARQPEPAKTQEPQPEPVIQPQPPPQPEPVIQPQPPPQVGPAKQPQPQPQPVAGPVDLAKNLLTKTMRATAFIRVDVGQQAATGSGFVVKSTGDTAYLITNYHVIDVEEQAAPAQPGNPGGRMRPGRRNVIHPSDFLRRGRPAPAQKAQRKITVVFNSGTPDEQALSAEVVATDEESDLAALRVTGARNLPEALDISQEGILVEQQPVYIFGFPANRAQPGAAHPPLTVGRGTIAGLRRDANNELIDVHINGDVNPGNSGGPVIDSNGRLVGIAVATVLGKQIGFAIPAVKLHQMFKGRLSTGFVVQLSQRGMRLHLTGEIWGHDHKGNDCGRKVISTPLSDVPRGSPPLPTNEYIVLARLADPMLKIKASKAYVAITDNLPTQSGEHGWTKIAKGIPVELKIQDQMALGSFKLPKGVVPDRMFAFQFSYINADGKTIFTQPHQVRLTFPQNTLSVTINISGIPDAPTRRYIEDMAVKLLPGKVRVVSWSKDNLVLEVDPVPDPKVISTKITFGEVTSIEGRTFAVKAKKLDLPPPTDAEVASALEGLKSNNKQRRIAAADQLAKVYALLPPRRAEVAKALEPLVADKDIWIANAGLRALYMWGGSENIAAVIPALDNNFTSGEAIRVLSKFKDASVADALAKLLPKGGARGAAGAALKQLGPIAEKAVIPFVNNTDFWCAMEACHILKEIGTAQSIPALTQAVNNPAFPAKMAAQEALKTVQARTKSGAGR